MAETDNARPQPVPEYVESCSTDFTTTNHCRRAAPQFLKVRIDQLGRQETSRIDITLLRNRSTYYAAIIAEPDPVGHVTLTDVQSEIFDYYIDCIYTSNVTLENTEHAPGAEDDAGQTSDSIMMKYCEGYLLARHLGDCTTANLIIDALIDHSAQAATAFGDPILQKIYEHTEPGSPLRKLAVDLWTFAVQRVNVKAWDMKGLLHEFAIDALKKTMDVQEQVPGKTIAEAFAYGFIAREKWRYHDYDELCPRPAGRE